MSYAAYADVQKASETPRDLEIRAVSQVTRRLADVNRPDATPLDRVIALNENAKLWSVLIEDLEDPGNSLPDTLKASYISIGMFARRTSLAAMSGGAGLAALIDINTDVLEALNNQRLAA